MKVAGPTCRPWMGAVWLLPSAPGGTTSATLLSPSLSGLSRMAMARDSFLTAGLLLDRCLQQGGRQVHVGGQVQDQVLWQVLDLPLTPQQSSGTHTCYGRTTVGVQQQVWWRR
jgi:hypothetical protein